METERLILRPWREEDALSLYKYAKNPAVGPIAGWPPHTSVENSREVIRDILSAPETYAVVLKETNEPVGSVGIMFGDSVHSADMQEGDAEIGYWIGVPYWGKGLIPEAVNRLLRRCFEELGVKRVWCGYYDGNTKSRRVMDKCGFKFHHTEEGKPSPLGDVRTEHFTLLTKEEWEKMMDSVVDYIIRPLYPEEIHLLRDFLYEAIFIPEGVEPLPRDVVDLPELRLYIQDFGKKQDDCCLVVEYDGKVVGAVWTRIMNDYGHVDDETPSLSISLYKDYRNKGMGRQLMKEMMKLLESKGYHHVSLSVQKANYAVRMYLKLGFTIMKETEEEFIMVRDITKEASNYQRFLSGEYCNRLDSEVLNMIIQTRELLSMLDNLTLSEEERTALFVRMLGKVGQHSSIGRNFTCQCGKHIFIGEKTIINDNCTLMDENYIYIGSKVLIAPHVQFYTATHPVCFEERFVEDWNENSGELFFRTKALPITVEDEVWIGGGSIVLAGVTIGRGSVIGAGSVVTKSIPAHCVAVGNPCKVIKWLKPNYNIRPLEEKDILEMQHLFRSTVLNVNLRDYTKEEVADWASCGDDLLHWKELLSQHHFIGAFDEQGKMAGFSSMNKGGYLHSMFVHKDMQGRGVATLLLSEVEKMAKAYGVDEITSEVSLTAKPFFEQKGYKVVKSQKCRANQLELTNFVMCKRIL